MIIVLATTDNIFKGINQYLPTLLYLAYNHTAYPFNHADTKLSITTEIIIPPTINY